MTVVICLQVNLKLVHRFLGLTFVSVITMSHQNIMSSKRAKMLVASCKNGYQPASPKSYEQSPTATCLTMSPVSVWWDNIFEASDIPSNCTTVKRVNSVKRKLFSSPVKDSKVVSTPAVNFEKHTTANQLDSAEFSQGLLPNSSKESNYKVIEQGIGRSKECTSVTFKCMLTTCVPSGNNECSINQFDVTVTPKEVHCGEATACLKRNEILADGQHEERPLHLYPSQQRILAAKSALNSGKEHITVQGKQRKARILKPMCKESCKRCAVPKLTMSERQTINSVFWSMNDHVKQWDFIYSSVICTTTKTKFCVPGSVGEKLSSRTYQFSVCGIPRRVCKTMFKSTLSICDSWINSAISHFSKSEITPDMRGRKSHS